MLQDATYMPAYTDQERTLNKTSLTFIINQVQLVLMTILNAVTTSVASQELHTAMDLTIVGS